MNFYYRYIPFYEVHVGFTYKYTKTDYDSSSVSSGEYTVEVTNKTNTTYTEASTARGFIYKREGGSNKLEVVEEDELKNYPHPKMIDKTFYSRDVLLHDVETTNIDDYSSRQYANGYNYLSANDIKNHCYSIAHKYIKRINGSAFGVDVKNYEVFAFLIPIFEVCVKFEGNDYHFYYNMSTDMIMEFDGPVDNSYHRYPKSEEKKKINKDNTKYNRIVKYSLKLPIIVLPILALLIAISRLARQNALGSYISIYVILGIYLALSIFVFFMLNYPLSHGKERIPFKEYMKHWISFIFNILFIAGGLFSIILAFFFEIQM